MSLNVSEKLMSQKDISHLSDYVTKSKRILFSGKLQVRAEVCLQSEKENQSEGFYFWSTGIK